MFLVGLFYFYLSSTRYLFQVIFNVITSQFLVAYRLDVISFSNLEVDLLQAYIPMQIRVEILLNHFNPKVVSPGLFQQ